IIVKKINFNTENRSSFKNALDCDGWFLSAVPYVQFGHFKRAFDYHFNNIFPILPATVCKNSNDKSWITNEIIVKSNQLKDLYSLCNNSNDAKLRQLYQVKKKEYQALLKTARIAYNDNRVLNSDRNRTKVI